MKRLFTAMISLALLSGICGCAKEAEKDEPALSTQEEQTEETDKTEETESNQEAEQSNPLLGGWQINSSYSEMISSDALDLFKEAYEGFTGASYDPIAMIAKQLVNGTNYAYVCYETKVTGADNGNFAIVTLYAPLEGSPEIKNIKPLDITDIPVKEETDEKLLGGWEITGSGKPGALTEESEKALSEALEGYTGVAFMPIVLLGTQTVSGMNFKYLCYGTLSTADAPTYPYVVTVYRNAEGKSEISEVKLLDLEACVTAES